MCKNSVAQHLPPTWLIAMNLWVFFAISGKNATFFIFQQNGGQWPFWMPENHLHVGILDVNFYPAMVVQWLANLTRNHKVACSRPLQCCHLGIGSLNHNWVPDRTMWLSSLLRCLQQHGLYAPRGDDLCAGLRHVWVREVTVRSSERDAYKRVNP